MLCRQLTDAEAEVTTKAEERAKAWKTSTGSNTTSPNTTPNTSVEIVPKDASASSSKAEPNPWSHPAEPADGESQIFNSGFQKFKPGPWRPFSTGICPVAASLHANGPSP